MGFPYEIIFYTNRMSFLCEEERVSQCKKHGFSMWKISLFEIVCYVKGMIFPYMKSFSMWTSLLCEKRRVLPYERKLVFHEKKIIFAKRGLDYLVKLCTWQTENVKLPIQAMCLANQISRATLGRVKGMPHVKEKGQRRP